MNYSFRRVPSQRPPDAWSAATPAAVRYLRLRREDYAQADIEKWDEAFAYFEHEAAGVGPQSARQFAEILDVRPPPAE